MKVAIIGYGKMGHEIEKIALKRNHQIFAIYDVNDNLDIAVLKEVDIAFEFTEASAALKNYNFCFDNNIPVVSGTTGWLENFDEIKNKCIKNNGSIFYASNFSIGVNISMIISEKLAKIMNNFTQYTPKITEIHHTEKKDKPSGTAITFAQDIINNIDRLDNWENTDNQSNSTKQLQIQSERIKDEIGTHSIIYESDEDIINITHKSKTRSAFAHGAVLAGEFLQNKKGFYGMSDLW